MESWQYVEWLVDERQFRSLPAAFYGEALDDAKKQGVEKVFRAYMTGLRRRFGHDGLKIGHIIWVSMRLEKGGITADVSEAPSFKKKGVSLFLALDAVIRIELPCCIVG